MSSSAGTVLNTCFVISLAIVSAASYSRGANVVLTIRCGFSLMKFEMKSAKNKEVIQYIEYFTSNK